MRRVANTRRAQGGFTLIEVMIASVLGLVLVGGLFQIFIASKQVYLMHKSQAQMQENGRFALRFLHSYLNRTDLGTPTTPLVLTDNAGAASDEITTRFVVQTGMDGGFEDDTCDGSTYSDGQTVPSTFHIANDSGSGLPGLRCSDSGSSTGSQELVPSIEHMRLQYGVWDPGSGSPAATFSGASAWAFLDGATVNTLDAATSDLDRVYAIRVALISRSIEEARLGAESRSYTLLDQTLAKNDRYLRQVYTTTILLQNRMQQ